MRRKFTVIPGILKSKKGSEFVEASMVLPILILCILSMILLMSYFYAGLRKQVSLHEKNIDAGISSSSIFKVVKMQDENDAVLKGLSRLTLNKEIYSRYYAFNEVKSIRLKEAIGETFE